jgi:hypothetical protein
MIYEHNFEMITDGRVVKHKNTKKSLEKNIAKLIDDIEFLNVKDNSSCTITAVDDPYEMILYEDIPALESYLGDTYDVNYINMVTFAIGNDCIRALKVLLKHRTLTAQEFNLIVNHAIVCGSSRSLLAIVKFTTQDRPTNKADK